MVDYKSMYYKIFNAATDAERRIFCAERKIFEAERQIRDAGVIIRSVQLECEKLFMEAEEPPVNPDYLPKE